MKFFARVLVLLSGCTLLGILLSCGSVPHQSQQTPPTNVLAYLHRIAGVTYQIEVLKSDGTTALVGSSGEYISVVLSPNSQKLLVSYFDGSTYQVATMNADGTGQTVLANAAGGLYPRYTPDGSKIVYEWNRQVAVIDADGSNNTVITNLAAGQFCFPASNGSVIAVGQYALGSQGLMTMNMDGSNQQIIVNTGYNVFSSFSADGSKVIFSTSDGHNTNLYSIGVGGSNLANLTTTTWNWDPLVVGNTVYFVSIPSNIQNPTTDSNQIYSVSSDGSNLTAVTNDTLYDGFKTFNQSCLNP